MWQKLHKEKFLKKKIINTNKKIIKLKIKQTNSKENMKEDTEKKGEMFTCTMLG